MRLAAAVLLISAAAACAADRPHVVFFFVDDLGWSDLGCYDSSFYESPHIDALCRSGVKFTQAYAAASICSPTRASLMSGKHPVRVDITDWIPGMRTPEGAILRTPEDHHQLALEELTFAEALQQAGYRTFYAGKWHLGGEGYKPTEQGFDEYVPRAKWWDRKALNQRNRGRKANELERPHQTKDFTRAALRFMDEHAGGDDPMLVFLAYNDVHTPIIPDGRRLEHFERKRDNLPADNRPPLKERNGLTRRRQDNAEYATMVDAVDQSVGDVHAKIDELGLSDDTIVVFFSDNGGLATVRRSGPTNNDPLRSGKGWLYEGGIRVPLIIRAPGVTKAGAESDALAVSTDLYPTLLELTGCPLRPDQHVDGRSLRPQLDQSATPSERSLYWHYPHYHGSTWAPGGAIRDGNHKLIEFFETGDVELYDLASDIGESHNLAATQPDTAERLRKKLAVWRRDIGAKMPTPAGR